MAKRKLKKKFKITLIILGGLIAFLGINPLKNVNIKEVFHDNNDSKIIEFVKSNDIYDEKYKDEYSKIEIVNENNLKDILATFLPLGYSGEEINYIQKLSDKNINKLRDLPYQNLKDYYEYSNFNVDSIERYNTYKENNNYEIKDVITYVNINLDLPPYTETNEVDDSNSLTVLVNKYNYLPTDFKPNDITYLKGAYGNEVPVRKVLLDAFVELQDAAKSEKDLTLLPTTAYRDRSFQATLYNNYVSKDGVKAADTYSARPGYSEHQTGLAIDLKNINIKGNARLTDDDYNWLSNNAYKYGFIIRFPKDKEFITGYQFENWHIRYVGKDAAKIIYDNKLTLEEYVDLYIKEY